MRDYITPFIQGLKLGSNLLKGVVYGIIYWIPVGIIKRDTSSLDCTFCRSYDHNRVQTLRGGGLELRI